MSHLGVNRISSAHQNGFQVRFGRRNVLVKNLIPGDKVLIPTGQATVGEFTVTKVEKAGAGLNICFVTLKDSKGKELTPRQYGGDILITTQRK